FQTALPPCDDRRSAGRWRPGSSWRAWSSPCEFVAAATPRTVRGFRPRAVFVWRRVGKGMAEIRIGISGWRYAPWRGKFYPEGLRQKDELAYAASTFSSIEINGTFYSLQRPESFAAWHDATPDNFVFAIKGARYITHMLKLNNVEKPLANFFAQGLLALQAKLGPVLWQLPPNFVFRPDKLAAFFDLLPRTTQAALALARRHDEKVRGRTWLKAAGN